VLRLARTPNPMNKLTTSLFLCAAMTLPVIVRAETTGTATAAAPRTDRKPVWRTTLGGERVHELQRSFVAADGTVWMLVGAKPAVGAPTTETETQLAAVDAGGREIARYNLDASLPVKNIIRFDDVAVLASGNVAVFVTTGTGELYAVTLDPKSGRAISQMRLSTPGPDFFINNIIAAEDGRLLVTGRAGAFPWLMKLEKDLAIRWTTVLDDEPVTVVYDAEVAPDGTISAVGGVWADARDQLWLALLTNEGQVVTRQTFDGHQARIARAANGSLAVIFDTPGTDGWDVQVHGFSPALAEEWSSTFRTGHSLPSATFDVAARPAGGWVVTTTRKDKQLVVTELRDDGSTASTYSQSLESPTFERLWNLGDIATINGDVVVPYTLMTVDEQQHMRQLVRVAKLPVHAQ
jgi:hypothetical protein